VWRHPSQCHGCHEGPNTIGSDQLALPSSLPVSSTEKPLPTISLGLSKTTASAVELILNLPKTVIVALRDGGWNASRWTGWNA
ncbi:unnamed protein product, partial [Cyprideis torosa]